MASISAVDFFCRDTLVKLPFSEKQPHQQPRPQRSMPVLRDDTAEPSFAPDQRERPSKNVSFSARPWTPESNHVPAASPLSATTEASGNFALEAQPFAITPATLLQRRHSMDDRSTLYHPPPTPEGSICDDDDELDLYDTTEVAQRPSLSSRSYSIDAGMLQRFAQQSLSPLTEERQPILSPLTEEMQWDARTSAMAAADSFASSRASSLSLQDIPEHAQLPSTHHRYGYAQLHGARPMSPADAERDYVSMNMVDTSPPTAQRHEMNENGEGQSTALSTFMALQASRMALEKQKATATKKRLKKSASESAFRRESEDLSSAHALRMPHLSRRMSADDLSTLHKDPRARPFVCETCHSSFVRAHDLKRHLKIHDEQKPYACATCDKTFTRLDALHRHMKVVNGKGPADGLCRSKHRRSSESEMV